LLREGGEHLVLVAEALHLPAADQQQLVQPPDAGWAMRNDNHDLRQQVVSLENENHQLGEKITSAKSRLEKILSQIPEES